MTVFTWGELEAHDLLYGSGGSNSISVPNFHAAGNKIIELAERIKAERAVAAMQAAGLASKESSDAV